MYNNAVKRTTIVASEDLLERLRDIAQDERVSLAEVIRQGLEWRASQPERQPRFIASGRSTEAPYDTARRAGEIEYAPRSWR
jgi:hypothetical protein